MEGYRDRSQPPAEGGFFYLPASLEAPWAGSELPDPIPPPIRDRFFLKITVRPDPAE
jgi:hypothetical protein